MTAQDRIDAVRTLGYGEREAAFLVLAVLHGGYFLRRQFLEFAGAGGGREATAFKDKLLARGHARVVALGAQTQLFHVGAKQVYAVLDESDDRHRRPKPALAIKARLMGLDYILAHRGLEFLGTERDRVAYFASELQTGTTVLPKKLHRSPRTTVVTTRYFTDGFPIGLAPVPSSRVTRVSLCYVDVGHGAMSGFGTYLRHYRSLLELLDHAGVVYVAEDRRRFHPAQVTFERFWREMRPAGLPGHPRLASLLRYFRIRARYEAGTFDQVTAADLQELRRGRDSFAGPRAEDLFERWARGGDAAVVAHMRGDAAERPSMPAFATWCPEQRYELFGTVWRARGA